MPAVVIPCVRSRLPLAPPIPFITAYSERAPRRLFDHITTVVWTQRRAAGRGLRCVIDPCAVGATGIEETSPPVLIPEFDGPKLWPGVVTAAQAQVGPT